MTARGALRRLGLVLALAAAGALAGCIDDGGDEARVLVDGTVVATVDGSGASAVQPARGTAPARIDPVPFAPTPPPSDLDPEDLRGFAIPFAGGCLPSRDAVMPNAPREYRSGVHEGIDFYSGDVCAPVERGTPVLAMYAGVVVRADHDHAPLSLDDFAALGARTQAAGSADEATLDAYRGRQVWIDHGNGVVSRYAHLDAVADAMTVGAAVALGDVVGGAGDSGTPEAITAPGAEVHLHVEVRVGDGFLGEGRPPDAVRALYVRLFAAAER